MDYYELAKQVETARCIWHEMNLNHLNEDFINNTWDTIALEMSTESSVVKEAWESLKCRYLRNRSDESNFEDNDITIHLKFLEENFVTSKRKRLPVSKEDLKPDIKLKICDMAMDALVLVNEKKQKELLLNFLKNILQEIESQEKTPKSSKSDTSASTSRKFQS